MLFIGDAAVSGLGVLNHGLAVASQTARFVARTRRSGCSWTTLSDPELTMSRAAHATAKVSNDVDVVVVVLGIPDVLLGTTAAAWAAKLHQLIATVRQGPSGECPVIVAAIPPMHRLRAMPRFLQRLVALQIHRLNRSTLQVTSSLAGVTYSPFPSFTASTAFIHDSRNWRTLHSSWGQHLAGATVRALPPQRTPTDRPQTLNN
jgi:hypothetical protein